MILVASAAVSFGACESAYTLEPTFCDDWCQATLKPSCNQSPSNCVRDCEVTKASQACFARQEQLLACYQRASDADFVCTGGGFSLDTRVVGGVCQAERDELFECEAPGIGTCLGLCRVTQEQQLERRVVSTPGLSRTNGAGPDAGAGSCPLLDQPCEDLCWFLFTYASSSLGAGDANDVLPGSSAGDASVGPAECLSEILLACYAEALPAASASPDAPSGAAAEVRTITEALEECSAELR